MNERKEAASDKQEKCPCAFKIAELPESCKEKIHGFEQELNKQKGGCHMNERKEAASDKQEKCPCAFKIAELPESCKEKIHGFEQELNKQGFWNIALVAYQKME